MPIDDYGNKNLPLENLRLIELAKAQKVQKKKLEHERKRRFEISSRNTALKRTEKTTFPKLNVLLIMDRDANRSVTARRLTEWNLDVIEVSNFKSALLKLAEITVNVIVLEFSLEPEQGFTAAKILKSHDKIRNIPMVYCSHTDDDGTAKLIKSLGVDVYLNSPVTIENIIEAIEKVVKIPIEETSTENEEPTVEKAEQELSDNKTSQNDSNENSDNSNDTTESIDIENNGK